MPQKTPFITQEQARELCTQYPTPVYVYDEKGLRSRMREVLAAFAWNPGFKEYFALKACPNPAIARILHEEGAGLDISSASELSMAERLGICGSELMFSSNDTPPAEFVQAARLGALINFDDLEHLSCWQEAVGSFPKRVSVRVNPGGSFAFANGIFGEPEAAKFGMSEADVMEAARRFKTAGVAELGLHALLASNTTGDDYYPALARYLFDLAVRVQRETGMTVGFVNLSGGVGIGYRPEDAVPNIAAIGGRVRAAFEEILVPAGMGALAVYTELGRFISGPFGALLTTVIHKKHGYQDFLGVDACSANLMRPMLYDAYHHMTVLGKEDEKVWPQTERYTVVGALCENSDQLAKHRLLPQVDKGDVIFIHDCGAHGHAMGYTYNGRLRSAEVLLQEDGGTRLIRRAETFDDYVRTLDIPGVWDSGDCLQTHANH